MKHRQYEFPKTTLVVRSDRQCRLIPKWCPFIGVEVSRHDAAVALQQLRRLSRAEQS